MPRKRQEAPRESTLGDHPIALRKLARSQTLLQPPACKQHVVLPWLCAA